MPTVQELIRQNKQQVLIDFPKINNFLEKFEKINYEDRIMMILETLKAIIIAKRIWYNNPKKFKNERDIVSDLYKSDLYYRNLKAWLKHLDLLFNPVVELIPEN